MEKYSLSPLQDFHQFACGGFLKDVTIPQGHSMFTLIGSKIDTQVGNYNFLKSQSQSQSW